MTRILLNLLTALSLLLCVAVVGLWGRSSIVEHVRTFTRDRPFCGEVPKGPVYYDFRSDGAGVTLLAVQGFRENRPFAWLVGSGPVLPPGKFAPQTSAGLEFGAFAVVRGTGSMGFEDLRGPVVANGIPFYKVYISYFFLAVLGAVMPAVRGAARVTRYVRRELRHDAGLCPHCGYNLRATSGRCPECGREATWVSPAP